MMSFEKEFKVIEKMSLTQLYIKDIDGEYLPVHIKNVKMPPDYVQLLAVCATITKEEVEKWCGSVSGFDHASPSYEL